MLSPLRFQVLAEARTRVVSHTPHPSFKEDLQLVLDTSGAAPDESMLVLRLDAWDCAATHGEVTAKRCFGRLELELDQIDLYDENLTIERPLLPQNTVSGTYRTHNVAT